MAKGECTEYTETNTVGRGGIPSRGSREVYRAHGDQQEGGAGPGNDGHCV